MTVATLPTGIDLYYETRGSGEAIVFIPGTGLAGNVWHDSQVVPLSQRFQVIVHDPRGCGRSSKPRGVYCIDQMACDVVALLDELNVRRAHVVGHSMGGRIGLAMALTYPGRVKSLILAASGSGPAGRDREDCIPGLPYFLMSELVHLGFDAFLKHEICDTHTYFTDAFRASRPEVVQAFYKTVIAQHAKYPEYLRLCMARHNWEGTHRLADVVVPTLVVIGDDDTIGSSHTVQ